jgi:hypothetical protein
LNFTQFYSVYLFTLLCRTFSKELALSAVFMASVKHLRHMLDEQLRWPEAVTYEEMNQNGPGNILRIFLRVFHEQKTKPKERRKLLNALVTLGQPRVASAETAPTLSSRMEVEVTHAGARLRASRTRIGKASPQTSDTSVVDREAKAFEEN